MNDLSVPSMKDSVLLTVCPSVCILFEMCLLHGGLHLAKVGVRRNAPVT